MAKSGLEGYTEVENPLAGYTEIGSKNVYSDIKDPNDTAKVAKEVLSLSQKYEVPIDFLEEHYRAYHDEEQLSRSSLEVWQEIQDLQKKTWPISGKTMGKEAVKGVVRFAEADLMGGFAGFVGWIGDFITYGGHIIEETAKIGSKNPDMLYNPFAEDIMALGKYISRGSKEAREYYIAAAYSGWENVDEDMKKTDPIAYASGRLSQGVTSSALSVLAMYLSGGQTAAPELATKAWHINRGLLALSTLSAVGGYQHAKENYPEEENFVWSTAHGLADGMIEYVMESNFLEGIHTNMAWAGPKEGLEEFVTGMLQNTRAGILENRAEGMSVYEASKKAVKDALKQSPWEVAAGVIGGWGVYGGSSLTELVQQSKQAKEEGKISPEVQEIMNRRAKRIESIIEEGGVGALQKLRAEVAAGRDELAVAEGERPEAEVEEFEKEAAKITIEKPPQIEPKPEIRAEQPAAAKQPWEMTREAVIWEGYIPDGASTERALKGRLRRWEKIKQEAAKENVDIEVVEKAIATEKARIARATAHRNAVKQAISEGKPVPAEVLAEYPELAKQAKPAPAAAEAKGEIISPAIKQPTLTKASLPEGSSEFYVEFDEMGIVPESRDIENFLNENKIGAVARVQRFQRGIVAATKGARMYRIDVYDNQGRLSKNLAKQLFDEKLGVPHNWTSETELQRAIPLEERFKTVVDFAKRKLTGEQPAPAEAEVVKEKDILGGIDPMQQIHKALKEAKAARPLGELAKKAALKRKVGAAAAVMKTNVKKGTPTEEAIFKSTGLLKGPLAEYDRAYDSIEDIIEPEVKEAAYQKIYNYPGLQYFEIVHTATSFKKLLAGTYLTPGDIQNIERVFGKEFQDITEERQEKSGLYEKIIVLWKAGLLTGIKTSNLNTLANTGHSISETAKDIPAVFVDSVASIFTGERTIGLTIRGVPTGTKEGFEKGWKYLRTGIDERDIGKKLDYRKVNFGKSKFAKALQAYEETIFHLLGAEDQPFYYGAKARSLYSQAIAQAKNKGLKGKSAKEFIENKVQHPTDEMLEYAVYDAEVAVFQNRTVAGDFARAFQKLPGGEIIVPFGRTPAAVATQIVHYSPAGLVLEISNEIHKGRFDQRKFSQAFGRSAVGTGALYIGTQLFKAGMLSLDYPDNEKEREQWKLEGRSPNSIKIEGKWRSVYTLGPVGNVILIGGHFQKMLEAEGSPTKALVTACAGGAKSFSEQTFVRGVNMAIDALVDPEKSWERWFSSMAGSLIPTIVGDFARANDEIERRASGPFEKVQKKIPWAREYLEPAVDVFGNDLPRYGGNILETMIDPTRPSKIRNDIVIDELRRLWDEGIKITPTKLGDRKGYDILTPEENTQLWRRAGELIYKELLDYISNADYRKMDDYGKGKAIELLTGIGKEAAKAEIAVIKMGQGITKMELIESGLLSVQGYEMLKYYMEKQKE